MSEPPNKQGLRWRRILMAVSAVWFGGSAVAAVVAGNYVAAAVVGFIALLGVLSFAASFRDRPEPADLNAPETLLGARRTFLLSAIVLNALGVALLVAGIIDRSDDRSGRFIGMSIIVIGLLGLPAACAAWAIHRRITGASDNRDAATQ